MNPHHRHPDPVQAEKDALVSEAFMNHVEKLMDAGDQSSSSVKSLVMSPALEAIDCSQILVKSEKVCGECGSRPQLIRRVANCNTLYFVEAPAYDVLLCLSAGSKWSTEVDASSSTVRITKEAASARGKKFDSLEVFWLTAVRDCSHEEDRVLGILGLLDGFHEVPDQLRADKSLKDQVLFVARHNFEFAFSLVVYSSDYFLQVPGLSWAADLRDNGSNPSGGSGLIPSGIFNSRSGKYAYGCVRLAQITKVTEQGFLHVSARVARGRLRYLAQKSTWRLHNVEGCPSIDGAGILDERDLLSATLKVGQIRDDRDYPLSLLEFDVHLIILESFIKPGRGVGRPGHPCVRIMVCCGQSPQFNLHNLCNTYVSATEILADCASTPIDCQVGGYGKDIPGEALTNKRIEFKRGENL
ncbi:hypothetical protein L7F22_065148 [Adiantum nelumboides]|nr:hypothetical protein [Adiantum nelumboides]